MSHLILYKTREAHKLGRDQLWLVASEFGESIEVAQLDSTLRV
jgi:hypothetical protein